LAESFFVTFLIGKKIKKPTQQSLEKLKRHGWNGQTNAVILSSIEIEPAEAGEARLCYSELNSNLNNVSFSNVMSLRGHYLKERIFYIKYKNFTLSIRY
jgi:hypothetical protein